MPPLESPGARATESPVMPLESPGAPASPAAPLLEAPSPAAPLESPGAPRVEAPAAPPLESPASPPVEISAAPPVAHPVKPPPGPSKGKRSYQRSWKAKHPWLSYDASLDRVVCSTCVAAEKQGLLASASRKEQTYITTGYHDWKHALANFARHEMTSCHQLAMQQLAAVQMENPTTLMACTGKAKEQEEARHALRYVFDAIAFLSGQGLPLRRRKEETGHFRRYLEKAAQRDEVLRKWLRRRDENHQTFTSPEVQKAIQRQLALAVTRSLAEEVSKAEYFAVIADETTDAAQKEQLSICLRFVSDSLQVEELFLGLYEAKSTTAEAIFLLIKDALIRLQLPIENLRGQCYDGAANMAGAFTGKT